MSAFDDAGREPESSPPGIVVLGPAGSGRTRFLSQVRERVQGADGFFFKLELDASSFWESARYSMINSLNRPAAERETQLKEVLWRLSSLAHISRVERRAIVGDDELTPQILTTFIDALRRAAPRTVGQTRHTLRALVLLGAVDFDAQDVGAAYLHAVEDADDTGRRKWSISVSTLSPQECFRDISWLVALAGPALLAIDQSETVVRQSTGRAPDGLHGRSPDDRDLEKSAHGLMSIRQNMRRTLALLSCTPDMWDEIRSRVTITVIDRWAALPLPDSQQPGW